MSNFEQRGKVFSGVLGIFAVRRGRGLSALSTFHLRVVVPMPRASFGPPAEASESGTKAF